MAPALLDIQSNLSSRRDAVKQEKKQEKVDSYQHVVAKEVVIQNSTEVKLVQSSKERAD
jgi:hypothetical protein